MISIPQLSIKPTSFLSPLPQRINRGTIFFQKIDILEKVKPKLEQKQHEFKLKKSLIPILSAGSDYDGAQAYGVIDFDSGEIIAEKNLSEKLSIASLTKIMTAVVALDLASLDETFTVSKLASVQIPTKVMLKPGEKYSLSQLLAHALISSANDSAQVIKEGIDTKFGQEVFIKAMNAKAQVLGLKNTHFENPQGLDGYNHFSTIEDLSILSHYAMEEYPIIAQIVGKEVEDLTQNGADMRFYLQNWNGLLGVYPGISGIKIGNTDKAGVCTTVLSEREGKKVLVVLLGAPGVLERDLWAGQLLDLGFSKISNLTPVNITEAQLKEKYASWKYFN